jgi:peptidoglycan/LPS O-acetylase OafA/YrhL
VKYRSEIDGLRSVAVLPVILFHAGVQGFSGGFVGVDVFFVISGFLITRIIADEMEAGRFSIWRFYERRARRILPALAVVILCCLPFAWAWMTPSQLDHFAKSIAATSLFASNLYFLKTTGYFFPSSEELPLLHTWSLAVEEQFYIVMPLLCMLLVPLTRRRFLPLLGVLALLSLGAAQWSATAAPDAGFYLMPTRAWELLAGAICALLPATAGRNLPAMAGLAMIVVVIPLYDQSTPFPSFWALPPVIGTALVLRYAQAGTAAARLLSLRPLVAIGLISYSAYLWHQPLLAFARIRLETEPSAPLTAGLIAATFALAWVGWRFVETPARKSRAFPLRSTGQVLAVSAVALAMLAAIGVAGALTDGMRAQRMSPAQLALLDTAQRSPQRETCHAPAGRIAYDDACVYGEGAPSWAIFGDSHGVELSYALGPLLGAKGAALLQLTASAFRPALDEPASTDACAAWTHRTVGRLRADARIDTVVLVYRINLALFGGHRYDDPDAVAPARLEMIQRSWIAEIEALRAAGKRVVVLLQAPELPADIERLVFDAGTAPARIAGATWAWWHEARNALVYEALSKIPEGVIVIDPAKMLCTAQDCTAAEGGEALYFDDNHPSVAGSARIAAQIIAAAPPG